jgi:hypothetical protein
MAEGGRKRTGGLSVSLAGPDGRVVGGVVAGMLRAASPIQVKLTEHVTLNSPEQTLLISCCLLVRTLSKHATVRLFHGIRIFFIL